MSNAQALWLMVSIQLGIFGLAWLAVSVGGHFSGRALQRIGVFNLCLCGGLLLIALRGVLPPPVTLAPTAWLVLGGALAMWSALRHLHGVIAPLRSVAWAVGAVCVLLGGLALLPQAAPWRVALLLVTLSALVLGMALDILPRAKLNRSLWPRRVLLAAAGVLSLFMVVRAVGNVWLGWAAEAHHDGPAALVFAYVVVAALSVVNAMLAYMVLSQAIGRLETLTRRDPLTGLYNRRGFEEALAQAWERWSRERRPFALLCIDIDHFKRVNDDHGHVAGDAVLVRVSAVVSHELRKVDMLCRVGGDELVALLDGEDLQADLAVAGRRIGRAVREMRLLPELPGLRLTVSVGGTPVGLRDGDAEAVLRRADDALYLAKAAGRDTCQVVPAEPEFCQAPAPSPLASPFAPGWRSDL